MQRAISSYVAVANYDWDLASCCSANHWYYFTTWLLSFRPNVKVGNVSGRKGYGTYAQDEMKEKPAGTIIPPRFHEEVLEFCSTLFPTEKTSG